jgi:hypothetical protein
VFNVCMTQMQMNGEKNKNLGEGKRGEGEPTDDKKIADALESA